MLKLGLETWGLVSDSLRASVVSTLGFEGTSILSAETVMFLRPSGTVSKVAEVP